MKMSATMARSIQISTVLAKRMNHHGNADGHRDGGHQARRRSPRCDGGCGGDFGRRGAGGCLDARAEARAAGRDAAGAVSSRLGPSSARCMTRRMIADTPPINAGAVSAKPSKTKNALPKPSHGGPLVSDSDRTRQRHAAGVTTPANSQREACRRLRSRVSPSPRLSAATGSAIAPSRAGSHAAASTEPRPKKNALPTSSGVRKYRSTLTSR